MTLDLDAIRARDAECGGLTYETGDIEVADRRALLAEVDRLRYAGSYLADEVLALLMAWDLDPDEDRGSYGRDLRKGLREWREASGWGDEDWKRIAGPHGILPYPEDDVAEAVAAERARIRAAVEGLPTPPRLFALSALDRDAVLAVIDGGNEK